MYLRFHVYSKQINKIIEKLGLQFFLTFFLIQSRNMLTELFHSQNFSVAKMLNVFERFCDYLLFHYSDTLVRNRLNIGCYWNLSIPFSFAPHHMWSSQIYPVYLVVQFYYDKYLGAVYPQCSQSTNDCTGYHGRHSPIGICRDPPMCECFSWSPEEGRQCSQCTRCTWRAGKWRRISKITN